MLSSKLILLRIAYSVFRWNDTQYVIRNNATPEVLYA